MDVKTSPILSHVSLSLRTLFLSHRLSLRLAFTFPRLARLFFVSLLLSTFALAGGNSVLMPVAFAATRSLAITTPSCLQAPANLDPTTLTDAQLRAYGLPERPPAKTNLTVWLQTINHLKQDHHVCTLAQDTSSLSQRRHVHRPLHTAPTVTGYTGDFAGNYAFTQPGGFSYAGADWNLPCMNTSTRNARASFWVGLGGFQNSGYLVQAGTDVGVDVNGNVSYVGWIESTNYKDYRYSFQLPNARCGNHMYVYTSSNYESNAVDYYIVDGGGVNYSTSTNWPLSVDDTGDCMVERLHDAKYGYEIILANFNYLSFSNCYINSNSIGNLPHNYFVMVNNNGNALATPGPISSDGLNFNVNWRQGS